MLTTRADRLSIAILAYLADSADSADCVDCVAPCAFGEGYTGASFGMFRVKGSAFFWG